MTLPPLPKCTNRTGIYKARWWHEHPLYDADQMLAFREEGIAVAVLAEREAIAQMFDGWHAEERLRHNYWKYAANEIRKRNDKE